MRLIQFLKKVLFLFSLLSIFVTAFANRYESLETIKNVTDHFIRQTISLDTDESLKVNINPSNSLLRFPECSQPVSAALPSDANKDQISAVELTCTGTVPWHTFIPVTVEILTKVIVARHPIMMHETITEDDIEYQSWNKNQLYSGYFKSKDEVIGKTALQLISAGTVLTKKNTQLPLLVHKDQTILLVARNNNVEVSMQGIAKSDGGLNESIKAFNPSSKRILNATVTGINRAEIIS